MSRHLIWAAAVVAAFLLGHALGDLRVPGLWAPAETVSAGDRAGGAAAGTFAPGGRNAAAGTGSGGDDGSGADPMGGQWRIGGDGDAAWAAALDRLDAVGRAGDATATGALQERLLAAIARRARDGQVDAAAGMLAAYLARNPYDPDAYLLDSDLRQMQGRARHAFDPLLDLLAFADDPAVVRRARDKLGLLVGVQETRLAATGDTATLIRLFEDLTLRDPTFDGHRLRLAHWLARDGRLAEAEGVLAETGVVGVDPEAREELAARIRSARSGLPLERHGGALHVRATVAGRPVRMLVDTGATTTAISRAGAAALGSTPTGERVRVRTAAGMVEADVHRVDDLRIGDLHIDALPVIVLDGPLPQDVDGLLGMDVLERFQAVPGTGLPMPAGSGLPMPALGTSVLSE